MPGIAERVLASVSLSTSCRRLWVSSFRFAVPRHSHRKARVNAAERTGWTRARGTSPPGPVALAGCAVRSMASSSSEVENQPQPLKPHESALAPLVVGYRQFLSTYFLGSAAIGGTGGGWQAERRRLYESLSTEGQHPKVMAIACCDSRVDPAMVTSSGPGDIFCVRNIANIVPPCEADSKHHGTSAALEFGVRGLGVRDIIVFGHSQCGGIRALMTDGTTKFADVPSQQQEQHSDREGATEAESSAVNLSADSQFIDAWMSIAAPARKVVKDVAAKRAAEAAAEGGDSAGGTSGAIDKVGSMSMDEQCALCERESLKISVQNLLTFPFIAERVAQRELFIWGWYFDVSTGRVDSVDEQGVWTEVGGRALV